MRSAKCPAMRGEMITPPRGTYPELTPFAKVIRSGTIRQLSTANHDPVRPKPVITSSAISTIPNLSHSRRTPWRYPWGGTRTPAVSFSLYPRAALEGALPRVDAELPRRQGEDQPAPAGLDVGPPEDVAPDGPEGFRFGAVQEDVGARDGHAAYPARRRGRVTSVRVLLRFRSGV